MAPAYKNINSGQIVESDEPREDLEALARWERLADGGIVPPAGTPLTEKELADVAAHEAAAAAAEAAGTAPTTPATTDDETTRDPAAADPNGAPPEEAPTEDWTHAQLDEYAAAHDVTFPKDTNKAAKVALLTGGAAS